MQCSKQSYFSLTRSSFKETCSCSKVSIRVWTAMGERAMGCASRYLSHIPQKLTEMMLLTVLSHIRLRRPPLKESRSPRLSLLLLHSCWTAICEVSGLVSVRPLGAPCRHCCRYACAARRAAAQPPTCTKMDNRRLIPI